MTLAVTISGMATMLLTNTGDYNACKLVEGYRPWHKVHKLIANGGTTPY